MTRILGSWKVLCYEHGVVEQHCFDLSKAELIAIEHRTTCPSRLFVCEERNSDAIKDLREENLKRYEDKKISNQLQHRKQFIESFGDNQQ